MTDAVREITNLLHRYAERMDRGDFAGVGALFEHATYAAGDGPPLGRGAGFVEQINRRFVILHEDGTPRTKHVTTNVIVEIDGASTKASARSYFTVFLALPGRPIETIATGRYHDAFARVDGRWRFTARRIFLDHAGDLSQHLRREPLRDGPDP